MKKKISFVLSGERISIEAEAVPMQNTASKLTVDLKPVRADSLELSITGETTGSAGQCQDTIRELGKGVKDVQALCDIWDRHHLNGMNSGTRAQKAALAEKPGLKDYKAELAYLKTVGLDIDKNTNPKKPYQFGSAWLADTVSTDTLGKLFAIMDRLNGKRLGKVIDVDEAPDFSERDNVIDSRDVIKRLEIYRSALEAEGIDPEKGPDEDDGDELKANFEEYQALKALDEAAGDVGDWRFGTTLVRGSYFKDFAEEEADQLGVIDKNVKWPLNHIDWEAAADELKADYYAVEFKGVEYWVRK